MRVNIYEYELKKEWWISWSCKIEERGRDVNMKQSRYVKTIECVDMRLKVGDLIDGGVIKKAIIVESGYDVYVLNRNTDFIDENLKQKTKLENELKEGLIKCEKYKGSIIKHYIIKGELPYFDDPDSYIDLINDGFYVYKQILRENVYGKDIFIKIYNYYNTKFGDFIGLNKSIELFGLMNKLHKNKVLNGIDSDDAELIVKFYDGLIHSEEDGFERNLRVIDSSVIEETQEKPKRSLKGCILKIICGWFTKDD